VIPWHDPHSNPQPTGDNTYRRAENPTALRGPFSNRH